jgi:general secretion pathway protein K
MLFPSSLSKEPNVGRRPATLGSGSDGFIIVAVLWILAALATLVSIYAIYVTNSAFAISASTQAIAVDPLAVGGVELAAYQLSAKQGKRPTAGKFSARIGTARIAVAFVTEAARIDLNAAPKELLTGLFTGFGATPFDASGYAHRIIAWRTKTPAQGNVDVDTEDSLYRSVGLKYGPRHAAFVHIGELWLIYGIPPVMIERALPYVTVYSGQAGIDILDAAPQVIAALPNMTPQDVQRILAARNAGTLDQETLAQLIGGRSENDGQAGGNTFRVGVRVELESGRYSGAEAVILLPADGVDPYRVLSWRNAFDGTTDQAMDFGGR